MYIHEIHSEFLSYYQGTYGTYGGKLYYIEDILVPEPDDIDDYGDGRYNDDGGYDVTDCMSMFSAYAIEQQPLSHASTSGAGMDIPLSEIDFSFPNTGLVNVPLEYTVNGKAVHFNTVKHVSRRVRRQWKRALRYDALTATHPNVSIRRIIESITGQGNDEFSTNISNTTLHYLYSPVYFDIDTVLGELKATVGTYAISPEWWIGQGRHGIIFGHNDFICGTVSDDNKFRLKEELEFLRESFNEVIGERYAA